jgi:hypothetical protein
MNLIEIQDKLNKLPPLPQSIQYLTAASNGQNPQVPPYMALARISEINKQMQSAQNKPQPPAEPLNQSLPKQAMQSMGIGALPQGAPPGMPPPQGMPQGAPQAAPQQAPQPVMAADGGLMSIPVDSRMFDYGSGGVVAFANQEGKQVVEDPDAETASTETAVEDDEGYDAEAELKKLLPQIETLMKQGVRPIRTKEKIEEGLTKDYGVDEGPIGTKYMEGLGALKEAKSNERGIQGGDIDIREKLAASKGLLDWSDASRGRTGMGGVGALGRSYINSTENFMKERTGLREDAIKDSSLMNEAQYKLQALRQAQKDGDVKAAQKADTELAKIAKDLGVSKNNLMARLVTGNLNLMGKYETAQASRDVAATRAKAKANASGKSKAPSNEAAGVAINAARLKEEHPDWSDARIQAEALRQYKTTATAPAVAGRERKDINEDWRKERYTVDYIDAKDKAAYERDWRAKWKRDNPDATPAPAAPAASTPPPPAPAAPAAPTAKLTQEQNKAAIDKANEAIRNGADPVQVRARLKAAGVRFE